MRERERDGKSSNDQDLLKYRDTIREEGDGHSV